MENVRVWRWLVLVLAVLNIALMIMLLKRPPLPPMMPPPDQHGKMRPAEILISELKFSPEQVKNFEKLKDEHHAAVQDLQKQGRNLRDSFFDLLKQDNADSTLVKNKIAEIGSNQMAIERVTFDHFRKVRALCDAEQKRHFDAIINDLLHKMAGPHPGGRGMHSPPPPQDPEGSPQKPGE